MSALQTCHKCGAQFDVSTFAPGQQFTCGSCGTVLTARSSGGGAPPRRTPGSGSSRPGTRPAAQGRTPGSRKPAASGRAPTQGGAKARAGGGAARSAGKRGPQYRPPVRQQDGRKTAKPRRAAAAAPERPARGGGRRRGGAERGGGFERGEKKGASPALLYGGGALVVAAILLLLFVGGGGDDGGTDVAGPNTPGGGNGTPVQPERQADSVASLKAEMRETNLKRASQYRTFAKRFQAVGGSEAEAEVRRLYSELIEQVDPDDVVARKFLGYTDFQGDILGQVLEPDGDPIPEEIANRRGYDFLDAVVEWNTPARRWMKEEDDIQMAKKAVAKMRRHAKLLLEDRSYRAGDKIRGNIAADPLLMDLNYETIWDAPYLICYSSSDITTDLQLMAMSHKERREKRAELKDKRKTWRRTLKEKAAIFKGAYDEWMKRYAERWQLKPLTDEYGGRPDYRVGVRSYPDGVPLCIWIFTDHEAFQKYHEAKKGGRLPPGVASYFMPATGWIFLFDDRSTTDERIFEINKQVHEGVHQLEYWFTRQRNNWRTPTVGQNAISEGIAEYLGSVQMDIHRKLKFTHVNPMRLSNMQQFHAQMKQREREYPVFPIEEMISFESYQQAVEWVGTNWGMPGAGMMLLYQQAWAFTYFLNEYDNHKYQQQWWDFFDIVLDRQTGHGMARSVFKRIFRIRDEDDWDDLNAEWKKFVHEDLLKRDASKAQYNPPGPDDWPEGADDEDDEDD